MELKLMCGRPESDEGREAVEIETYNLLDELGITFERIDHDPAFTMEICRDIDKVLAPAVICKNLFLCNRQQTNFYLLMLRGDKKFLTKNISKQLGVARLSFADEGKMMEYLRIKPGAVSVMGLMNDSENRVRLLIDKDVLNEEYLGCHPCVNTSSIRFPVADLTQKFLPAVHHDFTTVEVF